MNSLELSEVYSNDFGKFFHIKEENRESLKDGTLKVHIKTGGFQDFVDMFFVVHPENETIIESFLLIHRDWLDDKTQIIFAIDIIKSFLLQFSLDKEFISPFVEFLWTRGDSKLNKKEFLEAAMVIFNKKESFNFSSIENEFSFYNEANTKKFNLIIKPAANYGYTQ